jgi:hypothetical protein
MIRSHRVRVDGRRRRASAVAALGTRVLSLALLAALLLPTSAALGAGSVPNCTTDQGQALIDDGRFDHAIREFTCVIDAQPTGVDGYRGRIEAQLLLGRYSDAYGDYARVTAVVVPVHPDAATIIHASYADRLAIDPDSIPALTGASFARWWDFQYPQTIQLTDELLAVSPNNPYGVLFRGSSRVLHGVTKSRGVADLDRAIDLAPTSPDVRFIVADAFTYGLVDLARAFAEASRALAWGLDTPRVHAILAASYNAFGEQEAAAGHIKRHVDLVTTEFATTPPLAAGDSFAGDLFPGRTYAIPIAATSGDTISIATASHDFWDSIAVLLAPDGSPVIGSDDDSGYHAAFDWVAEETGVYVLQVTSFEGVSTGEIVVNRS